jgi:hypothetical protein
MPIHRFIRQPDEVEVVTSNDPISDIHRFAPGILTNGAGKLFRVHPDDKIQDIGFDRHGAPVVICWWRKKGGDGRVTEEFYNDFLKRYVAEEDAHNITWPQNYQTNSDGM